jgi:DNA-binding response OmpR family regulator
MTAQPTTHPRLVLAEDSRLLGPALGISLKRKGLDVTRASGPGQAATAIGRGPDVVLVADYRTPWLDGLEFARGLRALGSDFGYVVIAGFMDRELVESRPLTRMVVVEKPFELEELLHGVRAVAHTGDNI